MRNDLFLVSQVFVFTALYDDRSIRAHVHRTKDMLSLSTLHASLSTSLALQYELAQKNAATTAGGLDVHLPELVSFIGLLCNLNHLGDFIVTRLLDSNLIQIL